MTVLIIKNRYIPVDGFFGNCPFLTPLRQFLMRTQICAEIGFACKQLDLCHGSQGRRVWFGRQSGGIHIFSRISKSSAGECAGPWTRSPIRGFAEMASAIFVCRSASNSSISPRRITLSIRMLSSAELEWRGRDPNASKVVFRGRRCAQSRFLSFLVPYPFSPPQHRNFPGRTIPTNDDMPQQPKGQARALFATRLQLSPPKERVNRPRVRRAG